MAELDHEIVQRDMVIEELQTKLKKVEVGGEEVEVVDFFGGF